MNPQHAVPVINDNGFILSESRAICTYLIEKYGKDDSLYPKDPQRRALVNHRLYFDIATLSQSYLDYYIDKYFNKKTVDQEKMAKIHDAFGYLEKFLQDSDYVAGNNMTVADIVLLTAVSNFTVYAFDYSYYKNVVRRFATIKSKIPSYEEINEDVLEVYRKLVKKLTEE